MQLYTDPNSLALGVTIPLRKTLPPCSGPSRPSPDGRPSGGLDRPCARRPQTSAAGTEERSAGAKQKNLERKNPAAMLNQETISSSRDDADRDVQVLLCHQRGANGNTQLTTSTLPRTEAIVDGDLSTSGGTANNEPLFA